MMNQRRSDTWVMYWPTDEQPTSERPWKAVILESHECGGVISIVRARVLAITLKVGLVSSAEFATEAELHDRGYVVHRAPSAQRKES